LAEVTCQNRKSCLKGLLEIFIIEGIYELGYHHDVLMIRYPKSVISDMIEKRHWSCWYHQAQPTNCDEEIIHRTWGLFTKIQLSGKRLVDSGAKKLQVLGGPEKPGTISGQA
jgi:hypothetical protein